MSDNSFPQRSPRRWRPILWAVLVTVGSSVLPGLVPQGHAADAPAGRVLHVGPNGPYKTPSAAAAAAQDGDTVEIDAGKYSGDVAVWSANRLTIRGINGLAHLDANGRSAQQKAIWVIRGNDTTIENIEFSGCRVPDRNGAGIRQEGKGLVVRHCSFHDNENGILAGANTDSDIVVEHTEFHHNGAGDGYSHNLYIGRVRSFTLQFCSSHHANIGHLVKSRAETNFILYNRLMDEQDGRSSYVIDLPNGGKSFIIGNIIQHGPAAENELAVSVAAEGAKNPVQELYVVNNTYVNERARGGSFLRVDRAVKTVRVTNNLITGKASALNVPGETSNNVVTEKPGFVDAAHYDYRLTAQSPAIGAGVDPGKVGDFSLTPVFQYRHPIEKEPRPRVEKLDAGAYQFTPR